MPGQGPGTPLSDGPRPQERARGSADAVDRARAGCPRHRRGPCADAAAVDRGNRGGGGHRCTWLLRRDRTPRRSTQPGFRRCIRNVHAVDRATGRGALPESLTGRQVGGVCRRRRRQSGHLPAERRRTNTDQPDPGLRRRRRAAGIFAQRRADRISIESRRRWTLRHGPHRRGRPSRDTRRIQSGMVARRHRDRLHQHAHGAAAAELRRAERVVGGAGGRARVAPQDLRRRRHAAQLVTRRRAHRVQPGLGRQPQHQRDDHRRGRR